MADQILAEAAAALAALTPPPPPPPLPSVPKKCVQYRPKPRGGNGVAGATAAAAVDQKAALTVASVRAKTIAGAVVAGAATATDSSAHI